ncbi:hypothetical protein BJ170DRAFT_677404 [Xylariales sp. AK1849]|nr:hypothetical protein BJ170DRAFT_677404 [Xylariales sp. AK1849]
MYFTKIAVVLSLVASALAVPTGDVSRKQKRALTFQTYADFQISDGVAGNALAEAQAKFPIDTTDLANVSAEDLAILNAARETAEAAETDAFNEQIDAASNAAATALQNGKIKNKVLKLFLETTALQIEQAQGGDNQADIKTEQTKLNTNIALVSNLVMIQLFCRWPESGQSQAEEKGPETGSGTSDLSPALEEVYADLKLQDADAAGQASQSVAFTGDVQPDA